MLMATMILRTGQTTSKQPKQHTLMVSLSTLLPAKARMKPPFPSLSRPPTTSATSSYSSPLISLPMEFGQPVISARSLPNTQPTVPTSLLTTSQWYQPSKDLQAPPSGLLSSLNSTSSSSPTGHPLVLQQLKQLASLTVFSPGQLGPMEPPT